MSNELTVLQRAEIALESSKTAQQLVKLAASTKSIVAITNKAGRQECHAAAIAAADARIAIQKSAKLAREDAHAFSKAVIGEEKRLIEIIEPEERRLKAIRDEYDAKVEAERAAKAEAERKRIASIHERIAAIRFAPQLCSGQTAALVSVAIDATEAIVIDDGFGEFAEEAAVVKANALIELNALCAAKEIAEAEAARIAAEKAAEAERMAAERAALKAEREKLAEEKRIAAAKRLEDDMELERQRSEILAQNARIVAEQKRLDEEMREELARQEAEEKEQQKQQDATLAEFARVKAIARANALKAITPPTRLQITSLVADHFANGDYDTAELWLKTLWK